MLVDPASAAKAVSLLPALSITEEEVQLKAHSPCVLPQSTVLASCYHTELTALIPCVLASREERIAPHSEC